jgi:hypothetical protein
MSSCTPTAPGRRTNHRAHPLLGGDDNWVPRARDQEHYVITRVLYRPLVVAVTPGSGGVTSLRMSAAVYRPHHSDLGARAVVHRAYLEVVDKPGE